MPIEYVEPDRHMHISRKTKVYCASDIHIGNSRPTNDLHPQIHPQNFEKLTRFLLEVEKTLVPGNPDSFDLVFNGDTFDFWKAIPNGLPSELKNGRVPGYPLHSREDYIQRFKEILQANMPIMWLLARILFNPISEMGSHLYILIGNHDDPASYAQLGARPFKSLLVESIAAAGLAQNLISYNDFPKYYYEIQRRVHWTNSEIYSNPRLRLMIQHGHRFDNENKLRRENGRLICSEGQIITENFVNGLHDFNLNPFIFEWRRVLRKYPVLKRFHALERIDNFDSELEGRNFALHLIDYGGDELETLFIKHFTSTYWQADHKLIASIASLPIPKRIRYLVEWLYNVLLRDDDKDVLRNEAKKILDKGTYRVILFGHSHIYDAYPRHHVATSSRHRLKRQYVNTGTFMDVLKFTRRGNRSRISRLDYIRPVLVEEKSIPQRVARVCILVHSRWLTLNDIYLD